MQNVGGIDRALRIVAGLVLIALAISGVFAPWGWIGIVPLFTGLVRWCPVYMPFGIRTCAASTAPETQANG